MLGKSLDQSSNNLDQILQNNNIPASDIDTEKLKKSVLNANSAYKDTSSIRNILNDQTEKNNLQTEANHCNCAYQMCILKDANSDKDAELYEKQTKVLKNTLKAYCDSRDASAVVLRGMSSLLGLGTCAEGDFTKNKLQSSLQIDSSSI